MLQNLALMPCVHFLVSNVLVLNKPFLYNAIATRQRCREGVFDRCIFGLPKEVAVMACDARDDVSSAALVATNTCNCTLTIFQTIVRVLTSTKKQRGMDNENFQQCHVFLESFSATGKVNLLDHYKLSPSVWIIQTNIFVCGCLEGRSIADLPVAM